MTAIVVGGGHNGLIAAYYLAKAGLRPIVLERRPEVGGGAITGEIHPGFRGPTLSHETMLHAGIAREMQLERHGARFIATPVRLCAIQPEARPIVLHDDLAASVESIRHTSAADASAYPAFRESIDRVATVLAGVLEQPPPSIDAPSVTDLWNLLRAGRRFRALERRDGYGLLRWGPMAAADFVHEWFSSGLLGAALAGPGVSGAMLGPWSAGSTLLLLLRAAHAQLAGGATRVQGGPGTLTRALAAAATGAGAEIRTSSLVERIVVTDGRVSGIVLDGREMAATTIVSAVDPKTTFLRLIDPIDLSPDFLLKLRNYRAAGTVAKLNLALSALPAFEGVGQQSVWLSGRIHLGPDIDYLERAFDHVKYGEPSAEPWLEVTLPSLLDQGLAPSGAHVASIYVHYAPRHLRGASWAATRDHVLETALGVLERHAPGIRSLVVAAQLVTPEDLEEQYGFAGGHMFHGELALDQLFTMRPLLGFARYNSPIAGLYLCGAGTHPGGFLTGISGRLGAAEAIRHHRR
jgi:phytoene dehydrogenase-like protein